MNIAMKIFSELRIKLKKKVTNANAVLLCLVAALRIMKLCN